MKIIEKIIENIRSREIFPPGYESEKERAAAALLLALPILFSLLYFIKLYEARESLYYTDRLLGRTVRPGAVADSFLHLAAGYGRFFLPLFLFLALMMGYHYAYYYRDTRSIYLMKRLPNRWTLVRSCIQTPLMGMAAGILAMTALAILYYSAYLLFIPAECRQGF